MLPAQTSHQATLPDTPSNVCYWESTGLNADIVETTLLTRSRHGRLKSFAVQIHHCTPFRFSQFPALIAQAESQMWRSATDEGVPQGRLRTMYRAAGTRRPLR
jgi:hypothetical protein